jgi:hypothetical protein
MAASSESLWYRTEKAGERGIAKQKKEDGVVTGRYRLAVVALASVGVQAVGATDRIDFDALSLDHGIYHSAAPAEAQFREILPDGLAAPIAYRRLISLGMHCRSHSEADLHCNYPASVAVDGVYIHSVVWRVSARIVDGSVRDVRVTTG